MGLLNIQVGLKYHIKVCLIIPLVVLDLVTPEAGAKHEHLFNVPASRLSVFQLRYQWGILIDVYRSQ